MGIGATVLVTLFCGVLSGSGKWREARTSPPPRPPKGGADSHGYSDAGGQKGTEVLKRGLRTSLFWSAVCVLTHRPLAGSAGRPGLLRALLGGAGLGHDLSEMGGRGLGVMGKLHWRLHVGRVVSAALTYIPSSLHIFWTEGQRKDMIRRKLRVAPQS